MSDSLTPWTIACQASLSFTISLSLLKFMFIGSVIPSNHLILNRPLPLLPWSFPASGSFPMSQLFASGNQSIGASASKSVLPMNIQGWFLLGLTSSAIWRKKWQSTPAFLPGESHGQKSPGGLQSKGSQSQTRLISILRSKSLFLTNSCIFKCKLSSVAFSLTSQASSPLFP